MHILSKVYYLDLILIHYQCKTSIHYHLIMWCKIRVWLSHNYLGSQTLLMMCQPIIKWQCKISYTVSVSNSNFKLIIFLPLQYKIRIKFWSTTSIELILFTLSSNHVLSSLWRSLPITILPNKSNFVDDVPTHH